MRVLVACEFSGIVRDAFIQRGHDAVSCDIIPSERPGPHIQDDVLNHLSDGWDLMIAHPPCTYLSKAGCRWLFPGRKLNNDRFNMGLDGKEFFLKLLHADIEKIAIENPAPHAVFKMPKETQIIHPYYFGDNVQKTTLLWLKNLPKLESTNSITKAPILDFMRSGKGNWRHSKWFMSHNSKARSVTFPGIAAAMADQWGCLQGDDA